MELSLSLNGISIANKMRYEIKRVCHDVRQQRSSDEVGCACFTLDLTGSSKKGKLPLSGRDMKKVRTCKGSIIYCYKKTATCRSAIAWVHSDEHMD